MLVVASFDQGPMHGLQLTLNVQQYENLPFSHRHSGVKVSLISPLIRLLLKCYLPIVDLL